MRKYVFIFLFIWINFSVSAQDIISSFLDKHGKDDGLEVISIGKKMLGMMDTLTMNTPDLNEAIKGLQTIRIVSSKNKELNKEYYNSARQLLSKAKGMEEFFSMDDEDKELTVMLKESEGLIKELILLSEQSDGFSLISISGRINLDVLLKYSEGLNISELKELNTVKRNQ